MGVDSFLFDRVFQPITDRLPEGVSCFDVARQTALGWAVLGGAGSLVDALDGISLLEAVAAVALLALPLDLGNLNRAEKVARRTPAANPARLTDYRMRGLWLALVVVFLVDTLLTRDGLAVMFWKLAGVSECCSVYFRACNVLPAKPVRREAGVLAPVAVRR